MSAITFARIDYTRHLPKATQALLTLSQHVHGGVLEHTLVELVFLRVSQLNGCAYCLDMHATALRKAGVEPRKLDTVSAWRDSRLFDARERAALAWAEDLTTLPSGEPEEAAYQALQAHFDEEAIATLTMAVATINAWNRLGVGLQPQMP
ncbi:carboxymuconolactone decarboxylase family protein [Pseudoxanthomonas winnipegensis]|uniref:Carboxymuconolactone decarboxylase family protein n=1 Tax=Pseudoxanthomonas winnipegensis TaxID=2480810 RepID=A0A4Q8M7K3_9GAMM|nr:carboxymuconolactone decarboxylase family protein [Pseudoxanthomonas winnipegensis]TAA46443.1 carboxymuconolactone decarboxylase family protein [Pseudoxanthomonas winnipegensis]